MAHRRERDALGELKVPAHALYGAQTQRAVENFPISGQPMPRRFLAALGMVKAAAVESNRALGRLDGQVADALLDACEELIRGDLDDHFPVDVYQTGSGTSTNMNANEVLAKRALQRLGEGLDSDRIHPNDHVNASQSSNDVIPTATHVAGALAIEHDLLPALRGLAQALDARSRDFAGIIKSGRTHLMDATPVTLGQELGGYGQQVHNGVRRAQAARDALLELALGGTAVGTGLNRPADFPSKAVAWLASRTGLPFIEAPNHFEAQGGRDGVVEAHGQLNVVATSLHKIANDVRLLASGPRTGLDELRLPAVQPGSSIMPGKVNPVMCEMLTMVCARVMGNQSTTTIAGMNGHLELNVYLPLMAHTLLESCSLLARGVEAFRLRCVDGMQAHPERCKATLEQNLALCTALAPVLGYDRAADIAKEAFRTDRTVREVARDWKVLPDDRIDALLDPFEMTHPED